MVCSEYPPLKLDLTIEQLYFLYGAAKQFQPIDSKENIDALKSETVMQLCIKIKDYWDNNKELLAIT